MTPTECSKFTGIPLDVLISIRNRPTSTLQSGPPYSQVYDSNGVPRIVYNKRKVSSWMKNRNLLITAGEAAKMIGITRFQLLSITGVKRFDFRKGSVVVQPSKNLFVFFLKRKKKYA